jgi:hypothetical protein
MNGKKRIDNKNIIRYASITLLVIALIYNAALSVTRIDLLVATKYEIYQLASIIGIHASVPPNPYNTLAKQLDDRSKELVEQEQQLARKKQVLADEVTQEDTRTRKHFIFTWLIIFVLVLLVLVNYHFDARHRQ